MDDLENQASIAQRAFCRQQGAEYVPTPASSKLGFATTTADRDPVNGIRHPVEGDTNGWYIWYGEEFSDDPDFFQPMHAEHIYAERPELTRLLGLPPGYRFLLSGDHLDVWYDDNLLKV